MIIIKKLPKLYKNETSNIKNNNKKYCYVEDKINNKTIKETLDEIFRGVGYSYNIKVLIEKGNEKIETYLTTRTKNYVITKDNKIIDIKDINNIEILN